MIGCGNHRENPVNDCERTPKLNIKRYCIDVSNKIFYIHPPSGHPQSEMNLNTMITCYWPSSHY